ncbi:NAD(+) synthase [Nitratireductor sp. ZSWI3]|uniref:NAD(+) synthase n=1 Tax=Nitratireductor sp. ZSWI3 TaxID=2966359 RepID=UPI00214FEE25|nr:NAD(+) synthase [Nitratireductor sp. ZSWI3]MCR4266210.1 NAD(+) synthase [Nitratireductor sp. ZSWI3]
MTGIGKRFCEKALRLNATAEVERIARWLRTELRQVLRKRGFVIGLSGGIDSSVCAALAARAVGPERVFCLLMPERESDPESLHLGKCLAGALGLDGAIEDISPTLEAMGCYERRDAFIRQAVPDYGEGWASKIVINTALTTRAYNISSLVVRRPDRTIQKHRLAPHVYLGIVAATNMKQRTRKQLEYYHADRLNYAVIGTQNRLEHDQGFFVKNGDGAADVKPIAHLYKSQVYQLANHLGIPRRICCRTPTTDTYSLSQTHEEFFFALPYREMDLCLYGLEHDIPAGEVAAATGLSERQVGLVWRDMVAKRKAGNYLHQPARMIPQAGY